MRRAGIGGRMPVVNQRRSILSPVDFTNGPFVDRIVRYRDTEMINGGSGTLLHILIGTIDIAEGRFFTESRNESRGRCCDWA
jgi:hypothetical protein